MPRNPERDARELARRKQRIVEAAFPLFAQKTIEGVSLREVARASGMSEPTFYRHYAAKPELAVAVSTWAWESFIEQNRATRANAEEATAAEDYEFFLESFLRLYRVRRDLLRFNQFFNVYVQSAQMTAEQLRPYQSMMSTMRERFHEIFAKGKSDGTLRVDVPEEEMFSTSLHLMLAAVTRYAVGPVYNAGIDPERELQTLKSMLLAQYVTA